MDHVDKILAQWRVEHPEFKLRAMGVLGRMSRLTTHLTQGLDQVFSAYGLNAASFDVLATLRRSGAPYALTPSQLMDWTMVTSGTMTNRLDRLQAQGLIDRKKSDQDARSVVVQLTPQGLDLINDSVTKHVANQNRLAAALNPEEQEQLDRLLAKWLAAFEAPEG
ncbi:HTH-type transcriptional regulator MhqR [Thalassovita gelatinovora]|uniref:HTH-type transcriptional regulator MhqR n=1 Tax=Thalassovita gelatinovora TaxID=53501 RepID=A0A0P1FG36_THAGE|nr:MarR family transcriptional regulator [Thalassovita gelatinovora]QIZ81805.1 MarR family transcriptional regulator [Thalassovita gelatinovora]CUH67078.1 HTH-type transcriptional regulator MhqR [Thalassovita gelatinovora]SEP81048.1 transcriptional regulator, MarR family [Thalassovita gelatinovora]